MVVTLLATYIFALEWRPKYYSVSLQVTPHFWVITSALRRIVASIPKAKIVHSRYNDSTFVVGWYCNVLTKNIKNF